MSVSLRALASLAASGASLGCSLMGGLGDYDTDCETDWQGSLSAQTETLVPGVRDVLSQLTGVLADGQVVWVASRGTPGFPVGVEAFGVALGQTRASTMPATEPIELGLSEVALSHVSPFVWLASAGGDACEGALCLARTATPLRAQEVVQTRWHPMQLSTDDGAVRRFHRPGVAGIDAGDQGRLALVAYVVDDATVHAAWLDELAFTSDAGAAVETRPLDRMQGKSVHPLVEAWRVGDDGGFVVAYRGAQGDCDGGVRVWRFGQAPPVDDDGRAKTCLMPDDAEVEEVSLTLSQSTAFVGMRSQNRASIAMLPLTGRWAERSEPARVALEDTGRVRAGPALHATDAGDVVAAWVASAEGALEVQAQRFRFDADADGEPLVALQRISLGAVQKAARVLVRYDGAKASVAVTGGMDEAELTLGELSCASP